MNSILISLIYRLSVIQLSFRAATHALCAVVKTCKNGSCLRYNWKFARYLSPSFRLRLSYEYSFLFLSDGLDRLSLAIEINIISRACFVTFLKLFS